MPSWRDRLRAIAAERGLSDAQERRLASLVEVIERDDHAPTAVRDPAEAIDVHVADSLAGLEVAALRDAGSIADLGSGAGFPGLPLAIARPDAHVFLVESASRKAGFLADAVRLTDTPNAEVVHSRAEEWAASADVVTVRALDALAVLAEYAAPLLRVGGSLVAWKGRRDPEEEAQAAAAAAQLGLRTAEIVPVQPYSTSRDRHLHVMVKDTPTPAGFPRAPGRARKRPLR